MIIWSCPFVFYEGRNVEMRETGKDGFQKKVKNRLKEMFPGCIVTKLDSSDIQGIPDLLILHNNKWGTLEVKKNEKAKRQPNQEYYVDKMNEMSFSKFIYPENEEEVLSELKEMFDK